MRPLPRLALTPVLIASGIAFAIAPPAGAQLASSLLNEGDPLPAAGAGHVVSSLSNTAVNHAGGYAISTNSSDGTTTLSHVWGNASGGAGAILRTEGTFGALVQTSFESFYGIANDGSVSYSASGTGGPAGGFDSVWKNDDPVAVEGDPHPTLAGQFWRFGSRPGITAGGTPYFVGGITSTQGGNTENRGLFFGLDGGTVELLGFDVVPGLPFPLDDANSVSFDYRYSANAANYIAEVQMETGSTANDGAMVVNGAGLEIAGTLVREGNLVPAAVGGDGVENWDNFDFTGITEGGSLLLTGDTDGDTATDEFILKNGVIIHREGDVLDGETLSGSIEGAYMNEDGDIAFIWDIQNNALEALYLNSTLLLKDGDPVDLDGDGLLDLGTAISSFTGISSLTLSDRDLLGTVNVYFTADVDTAGTSSTTDDVEGFFCMEVFAQPTSITLSGLAASASPRRPQVIVEWTTSSEIDHEGFHVYRSPRLDGVYERLTDELLRGRSPYVFEDRNVRPGATYYYKIGAVDTRAHEEIHGPVKVVTPAWGMRTALAPNSPNPFVKRTEIRFTLERDSRATLSVFDVAGRLVATLVDDALEAGDHVFAWDGASRLGTPSAGGVYFYRLETAEYSRTRKMVHLQRP